MDVELLDSENLELSSLVTPTALGEKRPFEPSCEEHEGRRKIVSDINLDKVETAETDLQYVPAFKTKHLLALHRFKSAKENILKKQARIVDSQINIDHDTNIASNSDDDDDADMEIMRFRTAAIQTVRKPSFDVRKFTMMSYLKTLSFVHDAMLSVIITQTETKRREEPIHVELKSALAAAKVLIEDFSSKLTEIHKSDEDTEKELAILQSFLVDACSKLEELKTKANFSEELMHPYCTKEGRICHALGLEINFLRRSGFDKRPTRITDHLSVEEWICNFLEENYKQEKTLLTNASTPDKELLERIGFRADAVTTVLKRTSSLKEHLHIFDWAEMYVRDEFKYNPVLSNFSPRFPFRHEVCEEWLEISLPTEKSLSYSYRKVNVINLESRNSTSHTEMQDGRFFFPQGLEDETHKVLFHGTDHDSAREIFIHGARITHGRKNRDFSSGSGFYLTDDFKHSAKWAFCSTSKPVVLVYRVDRSQLEAFSGYSLVGEDKRNEWTDLVKQYRSGKPSKKLRKFMRDHDYIEGPRASSCDAASPKPKDGSYQMCVISDELAEALDGFLHSALFYGGN